MNQLQKTLEDTGAEIRAHHESANCAAKVAIEHALEAGRLLADVKAALPHGEFGAWVETHCGFTDRTARRYMRLHEHRESLPAGAGVKAALEHIKSDTVSDLPIAVARPEWLPPTGKAVVCDDGRGRQWFAWALDYLAYNGERQNIFACALAIPTAGHENDIWEYTKRGIRFDHLEETLRKFGLANPSRSQWTEIDAAYPSEIHANLRKMDMEDWGKAA